jgi:RNA polymerase sigma factor (sigma-70 family)
VWAAVRSAHPIGADRIRAPAEGAPVEGTRPTQPKAGAYIVIPSKAVALRGEPFVGSDVMRSTALSRYRAERLLRSDFAKLRSSVLAVVRSRLRARGVSLDASDLEACYAQAWHGLYANVLAGEHVEEPAAWLVLVTFRRAIDESRARSRAALGRQLLDEPFSPTSRDPAETLHERARLRHLFEALRAELAPRERDAVSLCYLQGLTRAEAAARMGISVARMRKLMDGVEGRPGVAARFGELIRAVGAGEWCERQASLMRAYAFGLLDPDGERHRLAVAHLRECPSCRTHVACLRGLASVLAPPPFTLAPAPARPHPARRSPAMRVRRLAIVKGAGKGALAKLAAVGVGLLGLAGGYATLGSGSPGGGRSDAAVSHAALATPVVGPGQTAAPLRTAAAASHPGFRRIRRSRTSPARPSSAAPSVSTRPRAPSSSVESASPAAQSSPDTRARTQGSTGWPPNAAGEFTPERPRR